MKTMRILMLSLVIALFCSSAAIAKVITVVNQCGDPVATLTVKHTTHTDAPENLLDAPMPNATKFQINIPDDFLGGWTVTAGDGKGNEVYWDNLDFSDSTTITIEEDGSLSFS